MSDRTEPLTLDDAEKCKCWLLSFEAHCRSKNITDVINDEGTSPKTDKFIEKCGTKALPKIISMLPGRDVEKIEFEDIKTVITDYIQPRTRLTIADRTNFLQLSQSAGESEVDFLARLNEASIHCQWDSLQASANDELIKIRFIAGLYSDKLKLKILEKLQSKPESTINDIIDLCQMASQLSDFVRPSEKSTEGIPASENFFAARKNVKIFTRNKCGKSHKPRECPAYGKKCNKCQKLNHFAKFCKQSKVKSEPRPLKSKRQTDITFEKSTHNVDIFTVADVCSEPLFQDYIINGVGLKFQVDTGAAMSIISEGQWIQLGSPELTPTEMIPTNYDGSHIETLGTFTANICRNNKSAAGQFIVVKSHWTYGLLGRDLINNSMSNIETLAVDSDYLPTIKNFVASIALIDKDACVKFCPTRNVPFHLRETLDEELRRLEHQGIISPVQHSPVQPTHPLIPWTLEDVLHSMTFGAMTVEPTHPTPNTHPNQSCSS